MSDTISRLSKEKNELYEKAEMLQVKLKNASEELNELKVCLWRCALHGARTLGCGPCALGTCLREHATLVDWAAPICSLLLASASIGGRTQLTKSGCAVWWRTFDQT
jgi:hypothetical protein